MTILASIILRLPTQEPGNEAMATLVGHIKAIEQSVQISYSVP